ncbi:hypothetical protein NBT05_11475 [Aquimarina sp. ERC-38]|uniref:hypothetical protein n=1 Tax=Aquimarina sp. ERC-38 TaxID=2949996 RepID=UPI002246C220|nr:hypothetical protein [Aquimarina sp. ERC-38]UZO79576.1 hypothetical protein NBT05_11475 [Aquimarina sp. ERC-38]
MKYYLHLCIKNKMESFGFKDKEVVVVSMVHLICNPKRKISEVCKMTLLLLLLTPFGFSYYHHPFSIKIL